MILKLQYPRFLFLPDHTIYEYMRRVRNPLRNKILKAYQFAHRVVNSRDLLLNNVVSTPLNDIF